MRRSKDQSADFQKFYYTKVGLGEGCGCAERVIDIHEFDRQAGKGIRVFRLWAGKGSLRRFLDKAGLTRRPKS